MAYGYWLPADSQRKGVVRWQEGPLVSLPTRSPSVPVTVASSRIEAELLVGMLLSNGVYAVVSADDAAGLEPQLQIHGVRILVAPCCD